MQETFRKEKAARERAMELSFAKPDGGEFHVYSEGREFVVCDEFPEKALREGRLIASYGSWDSQVAG